MTALRFQFPTPAPRPAFTPVPAGVLSQLPPGQLASVQNVYRLAWARTQAVLAPTRFEKLYVPCLN